MPRGKRAEPAAEPADKPNLEDLIRGAAAAGELTYLSLCPVAGKGPLGVTWAAAFSPASKWGQGHANHADPVEALKLAMQVGGAIGKKIVKAAAEANPLEYVDDSDFM